MIDHIRCVNLGHHSEDWAGLLVTLTKISSLHLYYRNPLGQVSGAIDGIDEVSYFQQPKLYCRAIIIYYVLPTYLLYLTIPYCNRIHHIQDFDTSLPHLQSRYLPFGGIMPRSLAILYQSLSIARRL